MIKLTFETNTADGIEAAAIAVPGGNGGKVIKLETDLKYLWLCLDGIKDEALLYIPDGEYDFIIPEGQPACSFPEGIFDSEFTLTARKPADGDEHKRRNLALNPLDVQFDSEVTQFDAPDYVNPVNSAAIENGEVQCYPHIYANRVTRHEGCFYAKNVIDGINTKGGHGNYPYHSWGTAQYKDPTLIIYFGREVCIDMVSLALRSDYALMENGIEHDTYWPSATLEFSDGTSMVIHPVKTGDYQDFKFEEKTVEWIRLKELIPERTDNFASLNQLCVWGCDK